MSIITFMFPGHAKYPCGGNKVVNEHANRLAADGHEVHIVYAGSLFWAKKSLYFKLTNCFRYLERLIKGYSCRGWFPLDKRIKEHFTLSLNDRHVPKSDIYICTSPYTAMYLEDYPTNNKYYFIQDYENWGAVTDEILRSTYHYPLKKITISSWLQRIITEEEHELCTLVPNGFDMNYFHQTISFDKKDKYRVTMLYHTMERKDCPCGFKALQIVKEQYPQLKVNIFGTPERPENLPEWYEYHQRPDRDTHNRIYNEAAIFIGTSKVEGWGLPIGEAMFCGAAVACTDNPGYLEMAKDGVTALVSPVHDSEALAKNIIRLIEDDELRQRIAQVGHEFIQQFTWEESYKRMKQALGLIIDSNNMEIHR